MRPELVALALIVGLATWVFRFLPTKVRLSRIDPNGPLRRFLVATGPAAIATLFVASILPMVSADFRADLKLAIGISAVLLVYAARQSVVGATLAGALAFGLATLWLG
jgi:branched-subunit amino acid transport protein